MRTAKAIHPAIAGDASWQRAVCEYIELLRQHYGDQLSGVVLYGSRARGDAHETESDVDLLIVLRGEFDMRAEDDATSELAREVEEKHDEYALLGSIVATEHDYRRRMLPLFMNIRREGIQLWPLEPEAVREEEPPPYGDDTSAELLLIRHLMREALDDAQADLAQGRYRSAVNRGYFSMFHAATALLLAEHLAFSRHKGVISGFSERYVKTGRFPSALGKRLGQAFKMRNKADYNFREQVTPEEAAALVRNATDFAAAAEGLLDA